MTLTIAGLLLLAFVVGFVLGYLLGATPDKPEKRKYQ
jgi:hypothetical protein